VPPARAGDASADSLQLAALLELVDERDCVDGLALRIEREGGAVDLRVALSVEVPRVEDLAHRPDRARGEQHCPEDGFLGLEVLGRRDRGGFSELGDRCHVRGVNHSGHRVSIGGKASFRHVGLWRFAGERNTCSQTLRTEPVDRSAATSGKFLAQFTGPWKGL
jgi:hypothetical protein